MKGGCHEKQYSGGGGALPKKGGLEQFANLRGLGKKGGGGVFEVGLISQCTL